MAHGKELLNIKKPIVILGHVFDYGMWTTRVRALYMAHSNSEKYKELFRALEQNQKDYKAVTDEEESPLTLIENQRALKKLESETQKLNELMNETDDEDWTEEFHATLVEKAAELKSKKDALNKQMNFLERKIALVEKLDELAKTRKELDLEFVASLITDDEAKQKDLLVTATEDDALLAYDWITEGNALLTRSDVSLSLNRAQRRASQKVAN